MSPYCVFGLATGSESAIVGVECLLKPILARYGGYLLDCCSYRGRLEEPVERVTEGAKTVYLLPPLTGLERGSSGARPGAHIRSAGDGTNNTKQATQSTLKPWSSPTSLIGVESPNMGEPSRPMTKIPDGVQNVRSRDREQPHARCGGLNREGRRRQRSTRTM